MDYTQILIAIVALWGAALSTYTLTINIRKEKTRVKVDLKFGFLTYGPDLSSQMLFLEAANIGNKEVTMSSCALRLPTKQTLVFLDPQTNKKLPHKLPPGESLSVWSTESDITERLRSAGFKNAVKIRGVYRDAIGNSYISKSKKLPLGKK